MLVMSTTLRNWLIGCYITEYELNGPDRAAYGEKITEVLASALQSSLDRCYTARYLCLCRQFYTSYPHFLFMGYRRRLSLGLPCKPCCAGAERLFNRVNPAGFFEKITIR